ncbi:UGSC family (seleno)protein [Streptomyces mexicanus]|uniref:UGSC family (seleno)protein n=1 Tax=Streptomyces mexicanus TaxID=178566 RepID=UPI0031EFCCF0
MPSTILDPTGGSSPAAPDDGRPAPRSTAVRLRGARIGLLENTKHNAALLLQELGALLTAEHHVAAAVPYTKRNFAVPLPDGLLHELADGCDAVITGVGDCGSCSGSAVADGILLERHGVPTAVICSDAFTASADAMAELTGDGDFPYLTTSHPVAALTPGQVRERARQLLPAIVARLTGAAPGVATAAEGATGPAAGDGTTSTAAHTAVTGGAR